MTWTDTRLAEMIGCSNRYVGEMRKVIGEKAERRFRYKEDGTTVDTKVIRDGLDNRTKPVTASVKCPHCGKRFNLLKVTASMPA